VLNRVAYSEVFCFFHTNTLSGITIKLCICAFHGIVRVIAGITYVIHTRVKIANSRNRVRDTREARRPKFRNRVCHARDTKPKISNFGIAGMQNLIRDNRNFRITGTYSFICDKNRPGHY
jgi:hypothetical protein